MKKLLVSAATSFVLLGSASTTALAGPSFEDTAKVISAKPIYDTVEVITPREECWTERTRVRPHKYRRHAHNDSFTGPLAGALLGGVIGNQFGKGNGNTALTVGGALLGASIGDDIGNSHHHRPSHGPRWSETRRCEQVDHRETREEIVGYRVKYRYKGETYRTRMPYDPGNSLRVAVEIRPIK